ncbi:MAG: tetratricopeptide repeat protein [bacterium]
MRKSVVAAFLILFFTFLGADDDGFVLYLNKDYKGAYNKFSEQFINSGGEPLYAYNLGVTADALEERGEAVYFYIQALQMAPQFSEAKNNLQILAKEMNIALPQVLVEPDYPVDYLMILFFVSIYLFAALLSLSCFKNDWRIKTALLPVFLIMAVSAFMSYMKYEEENKVNWAVVVKDDSLKSGPDASLSEIGRVKEGEIINIVSSSGSWYKVKSFQDNLEGWIELKQIRAVARGHL